MVLLQPCCDLRRLGSFVCGFGVGLGVVLAFLVFALVVVV